MSVPENMTIAQRLMAKMGHKEGRGLGKDGTGIVSPIEATRVKKTPTGIGYEKHEAECCKAAGFDHADWELEKSNTVMIWGVPHGTDPAYLYRMFNGTEKEHILDIIVPRHNTDRIAFVVFKSEKDADVASEKYTGQPLGPAEHKIRVDICDEAAAVKYKSEHRAKTLTQFLIASKEESKVKSCTVLVRKLPSKNTIKSLKSLMAAEGFRSPPGSNVYPTSNREEPGCAAVRFPDCETAHQFIDSVNGIYWNNATIYAKSAPDDEAPSIQPIGTSSATRMLFVSNLPIGFTSSYIRSLFSPIQLIDVSIPIKKGTFGFAYLSADKVSEALKRFPMKRDDRTIYVKVSRQKGGDKNKQGRLVPDGPPPHLAKDDPVYQEFFTPASAPLSPENPG